MEKGALNLNKKSIGEFLINNAIYIVLLILLAVIIYMDTDFVNFNNFKNIITQASTRVILALGVAGLLVLAGTDLSVGRMVGLSALVSASLLQAPDYVRRIYPDMAPLPLWVVALFVMLLTGIASAINGYVIAKFKVTAFIVTLSMQLILYGGLSLYYDGIGGSPVASLDQRYSSLATGNVLGVPNLVLCAATVILIMWVVWNHTKLGKNMFAVGGNEEAAAVSGVNIIRTFVFVSLMAGLLYGFAGFLEAARTGSATNNIGNGYELDAIAACVVGGVSFNGGVGSVPGVVTGVFMFQIIDYGLRYINVSPYIQYIVKGLIIVIAVAIDTRKYIKKK